MDADSHLQSISSGVLQWYARGVHSPSSCSPTPGRRFFNMCKRDMRKGGNFIAHDRLGGINNNGKNAQTCFNHTNLILIPGIRNCRIK